MSERELLSIKYKLEENDHLEGLLFLISRSKSNWLNPSQKILLLSIIIFGIVCTQLLYTKNIFLFIPVIFIFTLYVFYHLFKKEIFLRLIRRKPVEVINKDITLTFLSECIETSTKGIVTKFEYSKITEIIRTNKYYFLLISKVSCIFIPTYNVDFALLSKLEDKLLDISNNFQIPITSQR